MGWAFTVFFSGYFRTNLCDVDAPCLIDAKIHRTACNQKLSDLKLFFRQVEADLVQIHFF